MKKVNCLFVNVNSYKIVYDWFCRCILLIRGWFVWKSGLVYIDCYFLFDCL